MEETAKVLTKHYLVGICWLRQIEICFLDTGIFPWFSQKSGSWGAAMDLGLQKLKRAVLEQVYQKQLPGQSLS